MQECAHERDLQIKLDEERYVEIFIDYVEDYFQLTPSDEQRVIKELHEDFNKQTYNRQTTSHHDSFCMSISENRTGLASTIDFKCNRRKQDKRLNNHHFPLHLPEKNKHHSSETRYISLKWYYINFQWVFCMQIIEGGGKESTNLLGMLNLPWKVSKKKTLAKIKAHAGMAEQMVRDLAIKEDLWEEIKHTLEHNDQSYFDWCALSYR